MSRQLTPLPPRAARQLSSSPSNNERIDSLFADINGQLEEVALKIQDLGCLLKDSDDRRQAASVVASGIRDLLSNHIMSSYSIQGGPGPGFRDRVLDS